VAGDPGHRPQVRHQLRPGIPLGQRRTRKLYNVAVFDRLLVRDGAIAEVKYREPFELIFNTT
jgi:hypothetical protein